MSILWDFFGEKKDEYNSNPQYSEDERLSKDAIESHRHHPSELSPCLPDGVTAGQVAELLQGGWWQAYDNDQLDEDGLAPEDDDEYIEEEERMTEFGALLQLNGPDGGYPYTVWIDAEEIPWKTFLAVRYEGSSRK